MNEEKKKIIIVFAAELEIEVRDYDEIEEYMGDLFDPKDLELELLGYFEQRKCNADVSLKIEAKEEEAIFGNSLEYW